jgi:alpha-glucoside transport system permease protein
MLERVGQIIAASISIPLLAMVYLTVVEWALRRLPHKRQGSIRPWLWLAPALLFLFVFLVYPALNTVFLSLWNANATQFVGLTNFAHLFTDSEMGIAIRNNMVWLALYIPVTVVLGLLMAVMTDRVSYERVAKAIMFLPMAISFVAAGVIWKFMYDYRPPSSPQTGIVNAVWTSIVPGAQPQAWLINPATNNLAIIVVAIWMFAGFCMVILSAGLKGIPGELLEAARVDGANEYQAFFSITLPLLTPTITVVATTMAISALKIFDIVYVLTNGNYNTDVIATQMYKELFSARDLGQASSIAVVLLIATLPIMFVNIRNFRQREITP